MMKTATPIPRTLPRPPCRSFKGALSRGGPDFKRLPFTHCAISFQPFEDAVRRRCTGLGTVRATRSRREC